MSKLTTAQEAHFLIRVGSWSIQDLEQWVQDRIEALYDHHDVKLDVEEFRSDWEWDQD